MSQITVWGKDPKDLEPVLCWNPVAKYATLALRHPTESNHMTHGMTRNKNHEELYQAALANGIEILSVDEDHGIEWEYIGKLTNGAIDYIDDLFDKPEDNPFSIHYQGKYKKKEDYNMTATWEIVDAVLNHSPRILLMGPPGTGKTYAGTRLGLKNRKSKKVYSVTMTPETPMAELRGHYVPSGGEYIWQDGPAIRAWREGARLVINEIDHSSPDCLSLLFAVLDDPQFAEFTLPTGETVRPAEGFQVVATMNGVPEDLPPALQDRFPVTLEIMEVNPEALAALPEDLRQVAMHTALHPSEERRISIRMWAEFANLRKAMREAYGDKKGTQMAAEAIFGNRADEALNALEMAQQVADA